MGGFIGAMWIAIVMLLIFYFSMKKFDEIQQDIKIIAQHLEKVEHG